MNHTGCAEPLRAARDEGRALDRPRRPARRRRGLVGVEGHSLDSSMTARVLGADIRSTPSPSSEVSKRMRSPVGPRPSASVTIRVYSRARSGVFRHSLECPDMDFGAGPLWEKPLRDERSAEHLTEHRGHPVPELRSWSRSTRLLRRAPSLDCRHDSSGVVAATGWRYLRARRVTGRCRRLDVLSSGGGGTFGSPMEGRRAVDPSLKEEQQFLDRAMTASTHRSKGNAMLESCSTSPGATFQSRTEPTSRAHQPGQANSSNW